uniref:NADH-ubiquinone oxidoreductase chain 1 n=1 Tax=Ibalia leucospoides TaxID=32408 RepID=A0A0E3DQK0_9HYME|nr:NADH dehydrogenase subunit 1 [Ibalia leucospoides]AIK21701.1 NADH dehydrogenase subunit 1 [Ibalia leucospoides]
MLIYMLNNMIMNLILMIMILISLAFLTLLERKMLGYLQIRKGPNKVSLMGILQPFSDAIKLFSKELFLIKNLNYMFFLMSPILSISLMLIMWSILPNFYILFYLNLNVLLFMCILNMGIYPMMMMGWSSNSMYSMLGAIRSIAQTISYEVSLIFIIISSLMLTESFNLMNLFQYQYYINFLFYLYPIMLMFLISIIAELNRTPFDLSEGESELVSGFNTEYMSGSFSLIFMAEYGMIMLMSVLFSMFYINNKNYYFLFYLKILLIMILIILFRGSYPRMRYDMLMMLMWKSFLPMILNMLIYLYFMKWLILYFI